MLSVFARSFSSETVELLVDKGSSRFLVHKDILNAESDAFRNATTGEWREATEGKIDLSDWGSETVGRFVEFLYTGDYEFPDPKPLETIDHDKSPESLNESSTLACSNQDLECVPSTGEELWYTKRPLTPMNECFRDLAPLESCTSKTNLAKRLKRFDPEHYDYTEPILLHAKLYAFGNYKCIPSVRKLALRNLTTTLYRLHPVNCGSRSVSTVKVLVHYVYGNTNHLKNSEEPLRRLVSHFVANNILPLQSKDGVMDLIGEGGDFAQDVVGKLCRIMRADQHLAPTTGYRFLYDMQVVHGRKINERPRQYVREFEGDGDVNEGLANYAWIVPEYTRIAENACTGIQVQNVTSDTARVDISTGTTKLACFITPTRDGNISKKITDIFLFRSASKQDSVLKGYEGISSNLNENRGPGYLYILWRSVDIA